MITRETYKQLQDIYYIIKDEHYNTWKNQTSDIDDSCCDSAINWWIKNKSQAPKLADIREKALEISKYRTNNPSDERKKTCIQNMIQTANAYKNKDFVVTLFTNTNGVKVWNTIPKASLESYKIQGGKVLTKQIKDDEYGQAEVFILR